MPRSAGQGIQNVDLQLHAEDDPSISKIVKAKVLLPLEFDNP